MKDSCQKKLNEMSKRSLQRQAASSGTLIVSRQPSAAKDALEYVILSRLAQSEHGSEREWERRAQRSLTKLAQLLSRGVDPQIRLLAVRALSGVGPEAGPISAALADCFRGETWDSPDSWAIHSAALHALLRIGSEQLAGFDDPLLRFLARPATELCDVYLESHHTPKEERYDILFRTIDVPGSMASTTYVLAVLGFNVLECELLQLPMGLDERARNLISFSVARPVAEESATEELERELRDRVEEYHRMLVEGSFEQLRRFAEEAEEELTGGEHSDQSTPVPTRLEQPSAEETGGNDPEVAMETGLTLRRSRFRGSHGEVISNPDPPTDYPVESSPRCEQAPQEERRTMAPDLHGGKVEMHAACGASASEHAPAQRPRELERRPMWHPRLSYYPEWKALTFADETDLDRLTDLIWDSSHALYKMPRDYPDGHTIVVPAEAVGIMRNMGFQFTVSNVRSMGDLTLEERKVLRGKKTAR